jgi:hypothetical protein
MNKHKQGGFLGSVIILAIFVLLVVWAVTNFLIPQTTEKCKAMYGQQWTPVFQGDFVCKNPQGDLKSIR